MVGCFIVCLRPAIPITPNYSAKIGFVLSTVRQFFLCMALGSASGWGVNAETLPSVPDDEFVVISDTTAELSWAGRLIRLYSTLAEIKAQPTHDNVPDLVSKAFADAHLLARTPGMLESASFRAMYVDAHWLYEQHHAAVAPIALTRAELVTLRETQFAMLATVDPALLLGEDLRFPLVEPEPVPEPEPEEPEIVIPVALRVPPHAENIVAAHQRRMMQQYGGLRGMQRTSRHYFPMIARALRRRGVPQELKYVAVIESSLDPNAESEAGAIGLWQFIPETGAMYGLSEDGLRSPSQSTSAAARHLQRLGRMFNGDWQLVLAAYNSGGGRVRAAVRQVRGRLGRQPTFWDIYRYLPAETRNYVSKFIATARVMGG